MGVFVNHRPEHGRDGTSAGVRWRMVPGLVLLACAAGDTSNGAPGLRTITLAPDGVSIGRGQQQQFTLAGHYSDGSSVAFTTGITWSSSDDRTATIDVGGLAHGVAAGTATITATHVATGLSATASLIVTAAMLDSVVVLPATPSVAAGLTQQLTVTGHYSDGASAEIASGMSWSTSDDGIATIDAGGLARGVAKGTATLTATHGASGLSGTSSLTVTDAIPQSIALSPNPASITVGVHRQMTATEHYSDGTTRVFDDHPVPIDYSLIWATSNGAVATVDHTGDVDAVALGTATVTVTDSSSGISDTASLTVIPAVLQFVSVDPPTASIAVGGSQQFTATDCWSNGGESILLSGVTWSSSNRAVAIVDARGGAHGVAAGAVTITATDASGLSGTATLTVSGP